MDLDAYVTSILDQYLPKRKWKVIPSTTYLVICVGYEGPTIYKSIEGAIVQVPTEDLDYLKERL